MDPFLENTWGDVHTRLTVAAANQIQRQLPQNLRSRIKEHDCVCVVRAEFSSRAECYDLPLRERLPVIRIPRRPEDRDVTLDLQALIDAAWSDGGYARTNYEREPLPSFDPDGVEWIRKMIADDRSQRTQATA
jgi:hypothetical protein